MVLGVFEEDKLGIKMDAKDFLLSLARESHKVQDHLEVVEFVCEKENPHPFSAYLRMNDIESALDSLFRAEEHIKRVDENAFHWKWVIVCLQNSLYVFALKFAAGTDSRNVQSESGRVEGFIEAIKLCLEKSLRLKKLKVPVPFFELTRGQKNSILWLHDFRNNFEHFPPNKNWSINLSLLPNVCVHVLEAIKSLALDCKDIRYYVEAERYYAEFFRKNCLVPWVGFDETEINYREHKRKKIEASIEKSIETLKSSRFYGRDNLIRKRKDLSKLLGGL